MIKVRWFNIPVDILQVILDMTVNAFANQNNATSFTGLMIQPTVLKHWRRVVSHPDRPQSNQAHLTVLQ